MLQGGNKPLLLVGIGLFVIDNISYYKQIVDFKPAVPLPGVLGSPPEILVSPGRYGHHQGIHDRIPVHIVLGEVHLILVIPQGLHNQILQRSVLLIVRHIPFGRVPVYIPVHMQPAVGRLGKICGHTVLPGKDPPLQLFQRHHVILKFYVLELNQENGKTHLPHGSHHLAPPSLVDRLNVLLSVEFLTGVPGKN